MFHGVGLWSKNKKYLQLFKIFTSHSATPSSFNPFIKQFDNRWHYGANDTCSMSVDIQYIMQRYGIYQQTVGIGKSTEYTYYTKFIQFNKY